MSDILLITSSPRGTASLSTRFATEIANGLAERRPGSSLTVRDLYAHPLPHIDEAYVVGRTRPAEERSPEQAAAVALTEALIAELQASDTVVIGSGMINFAPPTQLKSWFDYVLTPGLAFRYTDDNQVEGLITGKKVYLVAAAGGFYAEPPTAAMDHQSEYLKFVLGFLGMTDVELLRIEGMVYGPEAASKAIADAESAVATLLARAT
jgi:FMN-dependent NADH-azoreductase